MPRAQDVPPDQRAAGTLGARRAARAAYAARKIQTIVDGTPKLTPDQLDKLGAMLSDEATALRAKHIREAIDAAPPLTQDQADRLASLLCPTGRTPRKAAST